MDLGKEGKKLFAGFQNSRVFGFFVVLLRFFLFGFVLFFLNFVLFTVCSAGL